MKEIFEKIIEKFTNIRRVVKNDEDLEWNRAEYKCKQIVEQAIAEYNNGWIPCTERLPETDDYILLSFENFSIADIGRYENDEEGNGAFYPGDEDESYVSFGLFVNAWQPLPAPYQEEGKSNGSGKV